MNTLTVVIVSGLVAATLITGTAMAKRGGDREGRMIGYVSEKLELDANQTEALTTLKAEFKESMQAVAGDREAMREQLKALVTAPTFDQAAALAMINNKAEALQANASDVVNAAAVFFDGLNEEQKAELETLLEKIGERGHGRRGHFGKFQNHDE